MVPIVILPLPLPPFISSRDHSGARTVNKDVLDSCQVPRVCSSKQNLFIGLLAAFLLLQFSNCEEIPEEELVIVLLAHVRAARNIE